MISDPQIYRSVTLVLTVSVFLRYYAENKLRNIIYRLTEKMVHL